MSEEVDIGLAVLDHQLLDREERRCGKVDDLEIEGGPGESPRVVAILTGPDIWRSGSRWLGAVAARIGGGGRVRIPWEEVAEVEAHVRLKKTAAEYGLGRGDDRVRPWIARLPGADR
jgi:hypothetical protein